VGTDNATVVASTPSGILVNGTAARTTVDGPIPLGNVTSGNDRYGLLAVGSCSRTQVIRSLIAGNTQGGVSLAASSGITCVPQA